MSFSAAFPDEAKVRELAEQIRARLAHAQQLKLAGPQAGNPLVAQAEEIQRRLTDAVLKLQDASRDFSLRRVSQKLELIAQKLNLIFDVQPSPQGTSCFISWDAFYVEVCFQDNRLMSSIKLVHNHLGYTEPQALDKLLQDHTFSKLEAHLSGLVQVYGQAESQDRANVFRALSATESVLLSISHHSRSQAASLADVIMTQPLGHVTPRSGGLAMKLTYFIHPYEALHTSFTDHVISHDQEVGVSARILVEKSAQSFLLSLDPNLFTVKERGFFPINTANGVSLPLTFVLQHSTPIPICAATIERIYKMTQISKQTPNFTGLHINELIAKAEAAKTGKEMCREEYRFVGLPGQLHYYQMPPELCSPAPQHLVGVSECGTEVLAIPFTHPGSVMPIVQVLRKQLIYNSLLASCLGRGTSGIPPDHTPSHNYVFELSTKPPDHIIIHVAVDTSDRAEDKVIFEFTIADPLIVTLKVGMSQSVSKELSTILTRCLSIPVTLHAALKRPDTLLGPKIASLIKAYHRDMSQFTATISGCH